MLITFGRRKSTFRRSHKPQKETDQYNHLEFFDVVHLQKKSLFFTKKKSCVHNQIIVNEPTLNKYLPAAYILLNIVFTSHLIIGSGIAVKCENRRRKTCVSISAVVHSCVCEIVILLPKSCFVSFLIYSHLNLLFSGFRIAANRRKLLSREVDYSAVLLVGWR